MRTIASLTSLNVHSQATESKSLSILYVCYSFFVISRPVFGMWNVSVHLLSLFVLCAHTLTMCALDISSMHLLMSFLLLSLFNNNNDNNSNVLTGSYNNNFYIYDRNGKNDVTLQADKSAFKAKRVGSAKNKMMARTKNGKKDDINVESIDFTKKILHASWHPNENSIAIAATNNLFIFT